MAPAPKKKPLRADAERNRQRVLEVAQIVFAAEGLAVPIDEIARRAELGIGTVYRHFPTKEALFLAIVLDRMTQLIGSAQELADAPDPGAAFFRFLEDMVRHGAAKKDFMEALSRTGVDVARSLAAMKASLRGALAVLLERAQAAGAIRGDVGVFEVLALVTGTGMSMERLGGTGGAGGKDRLFAIVCDGLRARPGQG